jgi:hypothetical protein
MIWERDRWGKIVIGCDNHPVKIQKMLLMSSYQEFHPHTIDNYPAMVTNDS